MGWPICIRIVERKKKKKSKDHKIFYRNFSTTVIATVYNLPGQSCGKKKSYSLRTGLN